MRDGYDFGYLAFISSKDQKLQESLRIDCEKIAKVLAKFDKILGNSMVDSELWKKRQDLYMVCLERGAKEVEEIMCRYERFAEEMNL